MCGALGKNEIQWKADKWLHAVDDVSRHHLRTYSNSLCCRSGQQLNNLDRILRWPCVCFSASLFSSLCAIEILRHNQLEGHFLSQQIYFASFSSFFPSLRGCVCLSLFGQRHFKRNENIERQEEKKCKANAYIVHMNISQQPTHWMRWKHKENNLEQTLTN